MTLKLMPELVPAPLFHQSAHNIFKKDKRWKRIRGDTLAKGNGLCCACGSDQNPQCNEIWNYHDNEEIGLAELVGFEILCRDCHAAHHIGRIISLHDKLVTERVLTHLAQINELTSAKAKALVANCMRIHVARSQKPWTMKVAEHLLSAYPELSLLNTGPQCVYFPKVRSESASGEA